MSTFDYSESSLRDVNVIIDTLFHFFLSSAPTRPGGDELRGIRTDERYRKVAKSRCVFHGERRKKNLKKRSGKKNPTNRELKGGREKRNDASSDDSSFSYYTE